MPISSTGRCFTEIANPFKRSGTFSRLLRLSQANAKDDVMLKWALIFFVISIIAGFFGFSGVSAATATIARVLFGIALVIFLIFLVLALMAGQAIL
jgi:uncharacterized membrane protein YtjA (UPF0391 family)